MGEEWMERERERWGEVRRWYREGGGREGVQEKGRK
jgi:hypothetical protein